MHNRLIYIPYIIGFPGCPENNAAPNLFNLKKLVPPKVDILVKTFDSFYLLPEGYALMPS